MIKRTLEPEVMDTPEEAEDYDAMDHGAVNTIFVADFLDVWDRQSPVLDVGAGTAQIPIELCSRHPTAFVVAVDAAENMLRVARHNVERTGLERSIELQLCDAKAMPFTDASFPAVMSNSIVHHVPEPRDVIAEMVRVAQSNGVIFVRDLLRPGSEEELDHLVRTYAGAANDHQQKMFADSLRAALTLDEIRSLVSAIGLDTATVRQTTDRHWTWIRNSQRT